MTDGDLLWAPEPAPASRRPLSRAAIVAAAVELADAEGIDAVSMPRLARTLGAAPMSLYRHVPHKDALIDLMLDTAVGAPPPADTGSWRDRLAEWARANRAVFDQHPWTLPLVSGTRRMGPAECAWAEAALRAGTDGGLSARDALQALLVVNSFVRGASAPLGERVPTADALRASGRAPGMPLLTALLDDPADVPNDPFETGLARILDGLAAHRGRD